MIGAIGTYLPPWSGATGRVVGGDEDAVTLGVAAGRAALGAGASADIFGVELITREPPLLRGGNGAALLAGLGLDAAIPMRESLGGAPAVLAALLSAPPGALVIGVDLEPAAASAIVVTGDGAELVPRGGLTRSLPVSARDAVGGSSDYSDPRLLRERGVGSSIDRLGLGQKPSVVAGLPAAAAAALCDGDAPRLPSVGAGSLGFALAALAERGDGGLVMAIEQATIGAADLGNGKVTVSRDERPAQPASAGTLTEGADLAISLPAYDRAFDVKLRLEAAKCTTCGTLAVPPRHRCLGCGSEAPADTVSLPRHGTVHSFTTVHVPVPGKRTPYSLVIAEVGDTDVRLLVHLTGVPAGAVQIDDRGTFVFRRVAIRSGIPDYGYGFLPDAGDHDQEVGA